MKFRSNFTLIFFLIAICTAGSFAQKPKSKSEALNELAGLVASKKPEDLEKAYPLAKDFLTRFGQDNKDGKDKAITQVKSFVDGYRENLFYVAVDGKKYADAFAYGREILAEHPDDLPVLINLTQAGYNAMGASRDRTFADESMGYSKKAAQLMESGTEPKSFVPFKDKDEALAWMYFVPGSMLLDKDNREAAINIYRATTFRSPVRDSSLPYYMITAYYEEAYGKLSAELKTKTTDEEKKATTERVNKVIGLMMDAYARAYKKGEAEKNPDAVQWKARLVQIYKFTKKTEDGVTEYINYITTTPLPDPSKF